MKSLLLILPLISASSSPKSNYLSACEFIAPLTDFKVVKNENILHYSNGTFKIPLHKVPSGERLSLYFNENELFYWITVREKNIYTRRKVETTSQIEFCKCADELMVNESKSSFIGELKDCFCTKSNCVPGRICSWPIDSHCGNFMDFEQLKKEMKITHVPEEKKSFRGGNLGGIWARHNKLKWKKE